LKARSSSNRADREQSPEGRQCHLGPEPSGGATFVAVVQAAYLAECHDHAGTRWVNRSRVRRIFAQGEVRARSVVVGEVRLEDHAEVRFAEDDDVIQAVAPNGAYEALGEWILPRRARRGHDLFDAKAGDAFSERGPVDAVAVAQEVAGGVSSGNASTICWAVHSEPAPEVTFQCTTRRRSTESTKKT
jgi:hypothetical protein